jgi:hypothetical protein
MRVHVVDRALVGSSNVISAHEEDCAKLSRRAAVVPAAQCSRWNVVDVVWESYATSRGAPRMVMPSRGLGADRRDSGSSCHVNDLFGHSSVAWVPWWRVTCGRVSRVGQLGCCESRARGRRSGRVERRGGDDANKEGRVGERERVRNRIDRFSGNLGVHPRGHVRVSPISKWATLLMKG